MASRDPTCPLCTFLFTIAAKAAALAGLPGAPKFAMYALHVSSSSEVFFHAEDHCWFPRDAQPPVFLISPLYTFGAKATDWALRYNSCFMLPGQGEDVGPCARALGPRADFDVVRGWVRHCERGHTHPDCNPPGLLGLKGFRVIDCESRNMIVCPDGKPYVTLSYVWGTEPADNLDDDDILPETLPRLVEDAIRVTLSLGHQYLWVDRYCIPQSKEAVKAHLIRNMNRIYAECALTIIASASERPSDGLVGVSAPRMDLPESLRMGDLHLSQLITNLADEVERSKWNTRGWTYQEGFLSNKRLLFTKSQCYFQCGQMWCTEGLSIAPSIIARLNRPGHAKMSRVFPWEPHRRTSSALSDTCGRRRQREEYFVDRVREYMLRELTHDADAFDAFSGVLNYLETFAGEYLLGNIFGLPVWSRDSRWSAPIGGPADARNTLVCSLAWSLSSPPEQAELETRSDVTIADRRKGMPSWTWCGWRQAVPSSSRVEWLDVWARAEAAESDLFPEMEVSIEYNGGDIIPWKTETNPVDLLARGKAKGNARYVRVLGWTSQLLVAAGCWNDGPTTCQCGPYRLERTAARYLSTAAQRRGLPLTERGYALEIWFLSPLAFNAAEDNCCAKVMVLVPTGERGVYERLEALCDIKMEYFIHRPSVANLAERFGWQCTEFGIG